MALLLGKLLLGNSKTMTESAPFPAGIVSAPMTTQISAPEDPSITAQILDTQDPSSTRPDSPPGYFDIAPDSRVFFPPEYAIPEVKPSRAVAKEKSKGIYSNDPILDQDPDELWRFLVSNLRQPRMQVSVSGTHTESRTRMVSKTSQGANGTQTSMVTESYTETVTDFSFQMDVSKFVIPQWSRIAAYSQSSSRSRRDQDQPVPTVREALEEYTSSKNPFKEFRLKKRLLWDCERVTALLTNLVRSTGYRNSIHVAFPMQDYKVVALASNSYSKAAHSKVVRVLCVLSCLCIVCWPSWAIARKRMKNRLICDYGMEVNADQFYSRNCDKVRSGVVQRWKNRNMVAL